MHLWRPREFRGLDPNHNSFVGFGLVEEERTRLALRSHMLGQPLWVDGAPQAMPTFKRYYEAQGFSKRRSRGLLHGGGLSTSASLERVENLCRA